MLLKKIKIITYKNAVKVKGEVVINSIKGGVCSESLVVAASLFTHFEKEYRSLVTFICLFCFFVVSLPPRVAGWVTHFRVLALPHTAVYAYFAFYLDP
jgi:hypothetical protein